MHYAAIKTLSATLFTILIIMLDFYRKLRCTIICILLIRIVIMITKTLLSIGIDIAIGLSPLRNSSLAKILIAITGG